MEYVHHEPDPLIDGRNSFAFRVRGDAARPFGGRQLPLFDGLFLGDETVRGFRQAELAPWVVLAPNADTGGGEEDLRRVIRGSDTALGFNAEYRIPVSGGMETAAFFDLGIVGLLSQNRVLSSVPEGFTLLGESRSLIAGSTGLELRVPLTCRLSSDHRLLENRASRHG